MSRPLRIQYPNAHYHICARGNERKRIFWDEKTYQHFLKLLEKACARFDVQLYAFVLMTNHFHLMLQTPRANLSEMMHWLKTAYSVYINRKRKRVGHLFQGRYHSVLLEDESHYLELSRYIHLNPVRAKMVDKPEAYCWSSCHDYMRKKQLYPWLKREGVLTELGGRDKKRYQRYRNFIYAGMKLKDSYYDNFRKGVVLGSDHFKDWLAKNFDIEEDTDCLQVKEVYLQEKAELKKIAKKIRGELASRESGLVNNRATQMYMLYKLGYKLKEIGEEFKVSYSAVSKAARRYNIGKKEMAELDQILSNVKR